MLHQVHVPGPPVLAPEFKVHVCVAVQGPPGPEQGFPQLSFPQLLAAVHALGLLTVIGIEALP